MSALRHLVLEHDEQGIAWLGLDVADDAVNRLSAAVLEELDQALDRLDGDGRPRALIVYSAKKAGFCAGADVQELARPETGEAILAFVAHGRAVFERLAGLAFPTLALIHGHCLGGGLELALACDYRLAVDQDSTRLGLPEVRLGIFPGWGGIRRLPRLIGPMAALPRLLDGRSMGAREAANLGLVDAVVPGRLARQAAAQHVVSGHALQRPRPWQALLNHRWARPLLANRARRRLQARDPQHHYRAPRLILDLWQHADGQPMHAARQIPDLLQSESSRNLMRVFQLQERLKALGRSAGPCTLAQVHVIGAGTMGGGIAGWCALRGFKVTLHDSDAGQIARAVREAARLFERRLSRPVDIQAARDRLVPDPKGLGVRKADLILEAAVENAALKRHIYSQVEPQLKPGAFIATNTSSLALESLQDGLQQPHRLIGIHFFNPVAHMPLVEIVHAPGLDPLVADQALAFVHELGKLPLPVRSSPGFLVNAVLAPYLSQAMHCVDEGMKAATIDEAMRVWGMPVGPLELADTIGLDVVKMAADALAGPQSLPACLAGRVAEGHLGRKTGQGFYTWRNGKALKPARSPVLPGLAERLIEPMIRQAQACVTQGVVADADLADAGLVFGAGFAPFRGGPLQLARKKDQP